MSKTNHPRLPGTHRVGHDLREWRTCDGESLAQRAIAKREAIEEGLTERLYVEVDLDERAVPSRHEIDEAYGLNNLPSWERTLILSGYEPEPEPEPEHSCSYHHECSPEKLNCEQYDPSYDVLRRAEHEALEDEFGFDPFEDENDALVEDDWRTYATQEARDAALEEERAWIADREAEYARTYGDPAEDEDVDSEEHASAWLTTDPSEFFDALGDAWVIEGPSVSKPSVRAAGYMRVNELARYVGMPAADLVRKLRLEGEYVASHSAYVAIPVCRRVIDERYALTEEALADAQQHYDEVMRAERAKADLQARIDDLRQRLTNPITGEVIRPPSPRPGAPRPGAVLARPGRNPFLTVR